MQEEKPLNKLIRARDFIEEHIKLVGKGLSHHKAFEMLNCQYERLTGFKRYEDYESFKNAKKYHLRKK